MSTTTTDEIETALGACDAVGMAHTHDDRGKTTVYLADHASTTEPLEEILAEYDLRIWSVGFDSNVLTLVPASELAYPLGSDHEGRTATELEDWFRRVEDVVTTTTEVADTAPRLRHRVAFRYGAAGITAITDVLDGFALAIYAADLRHGTVSLVPAEAVTYRGEGE